MTSCFLRIGGDALDDAEQCPSIRSACEAFRTIATDLARFDQRVEGSIHIANSREELAEYPDFVLSLGPRGGLQKQSC